MLAPGVPLEVRPARVLDPLEDRFAIHPEIDRLWAARGPRELLVALFDEATRERMFEVGASLEIHTSREGIELECSWPSTKALRRARLVAVVALVQRIASFGVSEVRDVAERLEGR